MAKKKQKSNKVKKQSKVIVTMDSRAAAWKGQMLQQIDNEEYAEAIMTLAKMIEGKYYDADCMYQGAYAYFMTGDYFRATQWVENTLRYDGQNVPARLLLARICILEDRPEEGLAIFEFLLKNFPQKLDENQREDARDILDYYGNSEPENICKKYPEIAAFLELKSEHTGGQGFEANLATAEPDAMEKEQEAENIEGSKVEQELQQVRAQKISVAEKIKLLHTFAGGYFYQNDLEAAKLFLAEALELDEKDDKTLRNLAILYGEMGEKEKAMQFVMAMSYVDFLLLQALR